MLDVHFVILGACFGIAGQIFYIRDTLLGRTQPNRVTFLLWAVAPLLAFAVQINEGVGLRSLMTFIVGFGPLAIFIASFVNRRAVWRIGRFDYLCGALSTLGLVAWLATRRGVVALLIFVAADALAGLPTVVKSWRQPDTESVFLFAGSLANATLTLLTIDHFSLTVAAFPIYIVGFSALQIVLIGGVVGPRLRSSRARRRREPASSGSG